jgi:hypothetical protein
MRFKMFNDLGLVPRSSKKAGGRNVMDAAHHTFLKF